MAQCGRETGAAAEADEPVAAATVAAVAVLRKSLRSMVISMRGG